jgi:hypothetical protein
MDNFANQHLHVIADDSDEHENDEVNYIAAPETYTAGRASSFYSNDFQPRTVMLEHRQQYHHYDSQGRFDGNSSSRSDPQVHRGTLGCNNLHQLRPPASQRDGRLLCCCFASTGAMPRCCVEAASCNINNYEGTSSPTTTEDGTLLETELIAFRKAAQMTRTIGAMVIKRQAAMINRQLLQLQKHQDQDDSQVTSSTGDAASIHPPIEDNDSRRSKRQRVNGGTFQLSDSRLNRENRDTNFFHDVETCVNAPRSSHEASLKVSAIQASPNSNNSDNSICYDHESLVNTGSTDGNVSTASATRTTATSTRRTFEAHCPDEAAMRIWYQVDRMKRMSMFLKNAQLAQSMLFEELKDCYCNNIHGGEAASNDNKDMSEEQEEEESLHLSEDK